MSFKKWMQTWYMAEWSHEASLWASKMVFNQRSSSMKDCLASKVVFHWSLCSIIECLLLKFLFHERSKSPVVFHKSMTSFKMLTFVKDCLPLKVLFHWRLSFDRCSLSSNLVFCWGSPSVKGISSKKIIKRSSIIQCL